MKTYKVTIVECLSRTIEVEANSADEAENIVIAKWHNEEIVLDADDFDDVEINVNEED